MAKEKPPKQKGVPNRHLHARISFLYQAAAYLTMRETENDPASIGKQVESRSHLALQLGSHLKSISNKGQLRLSTELKRSLCKTCNTVLIPGKTATHIIENKSQGGKKHWADVLVVTCQTCNNKKRYPVGASRQTKKVQRHTANDMSHCTKEGQDSGQSVKSATETGTELATSSN